MLALLNLLLSYFHSRRAENLRDPSSDEFELPSKMDLKEDGGNIIKTQKGAEGCWSIPVLVGKILRTYL